jgi:hypothetical protein
MPKRWFDDLPHSHVALDDAIEQGALFCNMLAGKSATLTAPSALPNGPPTAADDLLSRHALLQRAMRLLPRAARRRTSADSRARPAHRLADVRTA